MLDIFICHSSKDKRFARKLYNKLKLFGVNSWIDESEIRIGDSLTTKIGGAINKCNFFGIILSKNSIKSSWVKKELQIALQKEIKSNKIVVLPILLDKIKIPPFLSDKLYADFTQKQYFEKSFFLLLETIGISTIGLNKKEPKLFYYHKLIIELKILDSKGEKAIWRKISTATPLENNITVWHDEEFHGSGKLNFIGSNIGKMLLPKEEGGVFSVTTLFSPPLTKGKKIKKILTISANNCFTKSTESLSLIVMRQLDELEFNIKLPSNRKVTGTPELSAYTNSGKIIIPLVKVTRNRLRITSKILKPVINSRYVLNWEW